MRNKNKPEETVESLRALKRRIYLWALIAGLLAILLGWLPKAIAGTTTSYEQVIFPATAALCLGLFIALWRSPSTLVWVELSLFAGTALALLTRLFEILFTPETPLDPDHLAAFSDLLYWFPLVYVLAVGVAFVLQGGGLFAAWKLEPQQKDRVQPVSFTLSRVPACDSSSMRILIASTF